MNIKDFFKRYISGQEPYVFELAGASVTETDLETIERLKNQANKKFFDLYENDGLTFMLVNYLVQKINAPFFFTGEEDLVKRVERWSRNIGFPFIVRNLIKDIILHGTAWCELVPDENLTDIVRIKIIDPTKIDFIRDLKTDKIKRDENGDPEGFVIQLNGKERYWYKDKVIDKGSEKPIISSRIEDLRTRICYFKLETYGSEELGISFIKPVYRSAIIRCNIADMLGESAFRGGGIVAYFKGRPSQEVINNLSKDLKNITSKNIFVLSENFQLDTVPIPDIKERIAQVIYLADEEAGALGIPLDILMTSVKTYRQDVPSKLLDLNERVKGYQDYLAYQIETQILKKLKEYWGMKNKDLIMEFRPISSTIKLHRTRALATLARRRLIKWDPELEVYLRKEEGLPYELVQEELNKWQKKGRPSEEEDGEGEVEEYVDKE